MNSEGNSAAAMGRCKTCKWWADRTCTNNAKIHERDHEARDDHPDHLVYSYDEGGAFSTGPEFGCVHHAS